MTINELANNFDLMSRTTKDKIETVIVKKDVSISQQLPSIVISSSTSRGSHNAPVTVVEELIEVRKPPSTSLTNSSQFVHPISNTGKHRVAPAKMEPISQTKVTLEQKATAVLPTSTIKETHSPAVVVPVCTVDVHIDDNCSSDARHEYTCQGEGKSICRPTTLTSHSATLSPSKPPELSISPAESLSLSKASSSNEQMSSSVYHKASTSYKPPYSPSSLSVNFCK